MEITPRFGIFAPKDEVLIESRFLPHWFQPGATTFLTFRTADSMPREKMEAWSNELRLWLAEHDIALAPDEPLPDVNVLPKSLANRYREQRGFRWNRHLDNGYGSCPLRDRGIARIVLDSLRKFDGERYDLESAVIMPNHVHVLCQFRPTIPCREQAAGWLHYSAIEINLALGRQSEFWQSEPFDHLVRSEAQFEYLRRYIRQNGERAGLPSTDYLYWSRESIAANHGLGSSNDLSPGYTAIKWNAGPPA